MWLDFDLEYPNYLNELYNNYCLVAYKIKIKKEKLPDYKVKIDDFNNISIACAKKFVFKSLRFIMKNCIFFNASIETSKVKRELEFNQSQ